MQQTKLLRHKRLKRRHRWLKEATQLLLLNLSQTPSRSLVLLHLTKNRTRSLLLLKKNMSLDRPTRRLGERRLRRPGSSQPRNHHRASTLRSRPWAASMPR
jgi:hypothetical protein